MSGFLQKIRPLKNPKQGELVLLTKYSDKSLWDPWCICNFAYKAVFANGDVSFVGWNRDGFIGYNGEYRHCFRLSEELAKQWFEYAKIMGAYSDF